MNYRHAFHAGNFADLLKHALLLELLRAVQAVAGAEPVTVVDTHAGAGTYDLAGGIARRTGEAAATAVLMADNAAPAVFAPLAAAVRRANPTGEANIYPGSPVLIARALRRGDRLVACEARQDEAKKLAAAIGAERVRRGDGWRLGMQALPAAPARAVVLVDPPFEMPGESERMAAFAAAALRRNPAAIIALWAPIKDLAGLDALRDRLAGFAPSLAVEARLRRLDNPLRLNGCLLLVCNPTAGLAEAGEQAAAWVVSRLGEPGGEARVEPW